MRWVLGTHPCLEAVGLNTTDAMWTASGPDSLMMATDPCCAPAQGPPGVLFVGAASVYLQCDTRGSSAVHVTMQLHTDRPTFLQMGGLKLQMNQ